MTNEADKPGVRGFFKRLRAKLNTGPAWLTTDIKDLRARPQNRRRKYWTISKRA